MLLINLQRLKTKYKVYFNMAKQLTPEEQKQKVKEWLANRSDDELDDFIDLASKEFIARHEAKKLLESGTTFSKCDCGKNLVCSAVFPNKCKNLEGLPITNEIKN